MESVKQSLKQADKQEVRRLRLLNKARRAKKKSKRCSE